MNTFLPFPDIDLDLYLPKLKADTAPLWGKMSAQHMLEHLAWPLRIAAGETIVPVFTPAEKVQKAKELFLMSDTPFKKFIRIPLLAEEPMSLEFSNMQEARTNLESWIKKFVLHFEETPAAVHAHPVFGPLNYDEWIFFQGKHFTHHFSQFGLV